MKGLTSFVNFSEYESLKQSIEVAVLVGASIFELSRAELKIVTHKAWQSIILISQLIF